MDKLASLPHQAAYTLIKAGIDSGSIKLRGTYNSGSAKSATDDALIDGTYLLALLTQLTNPELPKD